MSIYLHARIIVSAQPQLQSSLEMSNMDAFGGSGRVMDGPPYPCENRIVRNLPFTQYR
jgi:hypothetical protein